MAIEEKALIDLARDWSTPGLDEVDVTLVRESVSALTGENPTQFESSRAWQQLSMLFGDSGAPELCAITSLFALSQLDEQSANDEQLISIASMLRGHANLALLDLGLATSSLNSIPIAKLDTAIEATSSVGRWLCRYLEPLEGLDGLGDGAQLCLRLAVIRARIAERPEPFTLAAVRAQTF